MNEQEKLERLMEYSRQLAQQNAADSNQSETSSSPSAFKLDLPDLSGESDDFSPSYSSSSKSDPSSAPEISMPNLTADWDSIWNSGKLGKTQTPSSSKSSSSRDYDLTSSQTQYSSPSSSNTSRTASEGMRPRSSYSSENKSSTSDVDDDQYNWTRTRSTLRAVKGAVESYERSLNNPNDFSSDNDSKYLKPIDEIMKQNAEDNASSSASGKPGRFTANDFIGTANSDANTLESSPRTSPKLSGSMRPSTAKSNQEAPAFSVDARKEAKNEPDPFEPKKFESKSFEPKSFEPKTPKPEVLLPSQKIIASVKHLHKSFTRGGITVPVLQDLSLDVARGEFTAIIGQSGSGKSTLLNAIGLLCNIDAGEIFYEGKRIDNLFAWQKDKLRNLDLGLVFQFYHLLPEFTMLENILMPIMVRFSAMEWFMQKRKYRQRAMELIHKVGLEHRVNHKPRELSGGEMQRAAIARALIASPKLLLADEPTGNLDQKTGREILELLYSLQRDEKLTILMVTHDPTIAREADRMYKLSEGKLL
jgi:lipoprotein-releasing system ATP-binding protein